MQTTVQENKPIVLPRLLIVDDDSAIRKLIRMSLEAECEIVGEAENGLAGIQADQELKPDVVLLDISMPVMDGFLAAESLKSSRPDVHIIFVSQHAERSYIEKAFRVGAEGYVLKTSAAEELITALREVLAGRTFSSFVTPRGPQLAQ